MYDICKNKTSIDYSDNHSGSIAYLNLSKDCFEQGKYFFSLLSAEKSLQLDPGSIDTILQIAKTYVILKKYSKAVKFLYKIDTENQYKDFYLKICYLEMTKPQSFEEEPASDKPLNSLILLNYSEDSFQKENYILAFLAAEKAYQIDPNSIDTIFQIGKIYVMQEKYREALPYLEHVNKYTKRNYRDYYLGRCYLELAESQSKLEEAAEYLNQIAISLYTPKDSKYTLYAGLANTIVAIGEADPGSAKSRYKQALIFFDTALASNNFEGSKDNITAYLYRAKASYGLGDYSSCLHDINTTRIKLNEKSYPRLNLKSYRKLKNILEKICEDLANKGYKDQVNILTY